MGDAVPTCDTSPQDYGLRHNGLTSKPRSSVSFLASQKIQASSPARLENDGDDRVARKLDGARPFRKIRCQPDLRRFSTP